jgi:hypothetical protein
MRFRAMHPTFYSLPVPEPHKNERAASPKALGNVVLFGQDPAGIEAFDLLAGELANRLSGTETAPECVARVLAKWRRFWAAVPQHMLSIEKLIVF